MRKRRSAFDRISEHLVICGARTPVPEEKQDDLELVVRRCNQAQDLKAEYGEIELSPYMLSLLRINKAQTAVVETMHEQIAVGV